MVTISAIASNFVDQRSRAACLIRLEWLPILLFLGQRPPFLPMLSLIPPSADNLHSEGCYTPSQGISSPPTQSTPPWRHQPYAALPAAAAKAEQTAVITDALAVTATWNSK